MEQVGDLRHHGGQPARVEEVLHQEAPGGLQVDEPRRRLRRARRTARAAGRRRRGRRRRSGAGSRSSSREIACSTRIAFSNASRVRMSRRLEVALDELDDLAGPAASASCAPARVDRRDRRAAGQRQPERLGHAGHRRGGAHRHAVAVRARHRVLDLGELVLGDPAGAELLVVVPAVACTSRARGRASGRSASARR